MDEQKLDLELELKRLRREIRALIEKRTLEGLTPGERHRLRRLGERERELLRQR